MTHTIRILLVLAITVALNAQQSQPAVVSDPASNRDFPPSLVPLTFPSHGVDVDGLLYLAGGEEPGHTGRCSSYTASRVMRSMVTSRSQSVEQDGTSCYFTIAAPGEQTFSQTAAIEDTAEAIRFRRDVTTTARYRIDPKQIVVVGHSFGGFLAGYEASHDANVKAVAMISATNLGNVNTDPKQKDIRLRRWQTRLHPVRGGNAKELFSEAEQHARDWNYVDWAGGPTPTHASVVSSGR